MTRPIYEPSLPRTDAVLGYGSDQLFRRPSPARAIPYPVFRAQQADYGGVPHPITVGTDNQTPITWSWWEFNDASVFTEGSFSGDFLASVYLKCPGIYLFNIATQWDNDFTQNRTIILNDPYRNSVVSHSHTFQAFDDWYTMSTVRDYWPFDVFGQFFDPSNPPATIETAVQVNQNSGIDQNVYESELLIVRLGDMDVTTPTCDDGGPYDPGRVIDGGCIPSS